MAHIIADVRLPVTITVISQSASNMAREIQNEDIVSKINRIDGSKHMVLKANEFSRYIPIVFPIYCSTVKDCLVSENFISFTCFITTAKNVKKKKCIYTRGN